MLIVQAQSVFRSRRHPGRRLAAPARSVPQAAAQRTDGHTALRNIARRARAAPRRRWSRTCPALAGAGAQAHRRLRSAHLRRWPAGIRPSAPRSRSARWRQRQNTSPASPDEISRDLEIAPRSRSSVRASSAIALASLDISKFKLTLPAMNVRSERVRGSGFARAVYGGCAAAAMHASSVNQ